MSTGTILNLVLVIGAFVLMMKMHGGHGGHGGGSRNDGDSSRGHSGH